MVHTHHHKEYQWLWQSTRNFLRRDQLLTLFCNVGLVEAGYKSRLFGACVLHWGQKPYAVKELNNIDDAGALVPGTTLQVPTVKEVSPVRALDYVAQN